MTFSNKLKSIVNVVLRYHLQEMKPLHINIQGIKVSLRTLSHYILANFYIKYFKVNKF